MTKSTETLINEIAEQIESQFDRRMDRRPRLSTRPPADRPYLETKFAELRTRDSVRTFDWSSLN